jgi:hypothetical protein
VAHRLACYLDCRLLPAARSLRWLRRLCDGLLDWRLRSPVVVDERRLDVLARLPRLLLISSPLEEVRVSAALLAMSNDLLDDVLVLGLVVLYVLVALRVLVKLHVLVAGVVGLSEETWTTSTLGLLGLLRLCKRHEPRSHDSTMEIVREIRAWNQSQAELRRRKTETGIMSPWFPTCYILKDIVGDSSVDIMHVFSCGLSRYMLSWLTDVLCPGVFTFSQLNRSKDEYVARVGGRIPDLQKANGTARGSCSVKLNASAAMDWTLTRCAIAVPQPAEPSTLT